MGLSLLVDADVAVRLEGPGELRARRAAEEGLVEGEHALARVGVAQAVVGVRDVAQILLALQVVEVEARGIGQEELVAGAPGS